MRTGFGSNDNVHQQVSADSGAALTARTYEFTAAALQVGGVHLILQVTKSPAAQMAEGSPNFEGATLTITAHEPGSSVSGSFTARWGDAFTVDRHAPFAHTQLCQSWEGTGCDVDQASAVPADCVCTAHPPFVTGEFNRAF